MFRTTTNAWKLSSVRKTYISVDERWLRTYVTDEPGSANDCYAEHVWDYGHVELPGVPTEKYKVFEEME